MMKIQPYFKRPAFFLILVTAILLIVFEIFINWQDSLWGRSGAMKTANAFMMDLHNADYVTAFEKLSPVVQEHISLSDFNYPAARPVSWQLNNIDRHAVVTGKATFSDGVQLPVKIRLTWHHLEWKIYGVEFGRLEDYRIGRPETLPRLGFMYCCDNSGLIDKIFGVINGQ